MLPRLKRVILHRLRSVCPLNRIGIDIITSCTGNHRLRLNLFVPNRVEFILIGLIDLLALKIHGKRFLVLLKVANIGGLVTM